MSSPDTTDSKSADRPQSSILWRLLRWGLISLAVLVTILAVVLTEENWRGKRAWESYRHEMEAKGEKLDWQAFFPPPVPNEQNFAMTPFLAPLFDYLPGTQQPRDTEAYRRATNFANGMAAPKSSGSWAESQPTDLQAWAAALAKKPEGTNSQPPALDKTQAAREVLQFLDNYQVVMDEIREATKRPQARFNISYEEVANGVLLGHLSILKRLGQIFQLRASAELALGQTDQALTDTKVALAISESLSKEPIYISELVRIALLKIALQPVWEGLAARQWTDAQLAELTPLLAGADLLSEHAAAMRGERAYGIYNMESFRTRRAARITSAIWYQNEIAFSRMYQDFILTDVDPTARRVVPKTAAAGKDAVDRELHQGFRPYKVMAALMFPALAKAPLKSALAQTGVDEAAVACALERYRLARGGFPQTLDELSPKFMAKVPHDILTGEPLKYRRTADGQFVLYSVGWNEKDDGGTLALPKSGRPMNPEKGDWVWQYPAK